MLSQACNLRLLSTTATDVGMAGANSNLACYAGNASPGSSGGIPAVGGEIGGATSGVPAGGAGNILIRNGPYRAAKNSSENDSKNTSPGEYTNPTTYISPASASSASATKIRSTDMLSQFSPRPCPAR